MKKIPYKPFLLLSFLIVFFGMAKTSFASEVSVSDWGSFKEAYENPTISKIKLSADITQPQSGTGAVTAANSLTANKRRTTSLEIDGSKDQPLNNSDYYKLELGRDYMGVLTPTETDGSGNIINQTLHVHDVIVSNVSAGTTADSGSIFGLPDYTPTDAGAYTKYWTLKLGNIIVPDGKTERIARWTRGQVYIYGNNKVNTLGENFYLGGVEFEEGATYFGNITSQNYSIFWWRQNTKSTDSGSGKFIINDNAEVKLRNTRTASTGYPALYQYVSDIIIGENSKFTATVPGSAMQFHGDGQTFQAKANSVVTLTSLANNTVIADSSTMGGNSTTVGYNAGRIPFNNGYATNLKINFEPSSSLFVIGSTTAATSPLVKLGDATNSKNNTFTIDTPKQFDIRNNGAGVTRYDAVQVNRNGSNKFEVLNSNLAFWKLNSNLTSSADFQGTDVDKFSIGDQNTASGSDIDITNNFNTGKANARSNIARINGLNTNPSVEWEYTLTDADKQLTNMARVIIGEVPDDSGLDENGDLTFIKQYANAGLPVTVTNNKNEEELILETNSAGYISTALDNYYLEGTVLDAVATRGKLVSDDTYSEPVFKITPPTPAKVNSDKVYNTNTMLEGKNAEPGTTVSVKVNDVFLNNSVTVDAEGVFKFPLSETLSEGDKVQIYLQDDAGLAPKKLQHLPAPITNNSVGNINPDTSISYSDAQFPPATTYIVEQGKSTLTIVFEDEIGNIMDGYTLTAGESTENSIVTPIFIGNSVDLTKEPFTKIQEQLKKLESAGYEVTNRPENETNLLVSEEEQTIVYKLKGLIILKSAPTTVDFGTIVYDAKIQRIDNGAYDKDLIINDTRAKKESWTLGAKLIKQMSKVGEESIQLVDSLQYFDGKDDIILSTEMKPLYHSSKQDETKDVINISDSWGENKDSNGIKLVVDPSKSNISKGTYEGIIEWQLMEATP